MAISRLIGKLLLACVICAAGLSSRCPAQAPADATNFEAAASEYQFGFDDQYDFELRQQPVMVWSNPATFDQKGAVFVWMKAGRPQVIGTLYDSVHSGMPRSTVELHSLADTAVEGRFRGVKFWHPSRSGLKFEAVGSDGQPAATPQRKLLQLRQISREFSATLTNQDGSKLPLRLLPTPILTYEPRSETCTDGAIFAFAATGTDPDAFLIIENRKVDGEFGLHYAFARFHFRELAAARGAETVWKAEAKLEMLHNFRTSPGSRDSPYTFFRVK